MAKSEAPYEAAGATLLAQQPPVASAQQATAKEIANWNTLRGHLEARLTALRNWRSSWWTQNW